MRTLVLTVAGGACAVAAAGVYVAGLVRGGTRPRIVSWATWACLNAIGSAAAFVTHQLPAAVLTLACALECALVAVLEIVWPYEEPDAADDSRPQRLLDKLDVACLAGALAGLVTLVLLRSPVLATVVTVLTDAVGAVPTVRHSRQRPWEETWSAYALFSAAGGFTLLAAGHLAFTAVAYPLYLLAFNAVVVAVILTSPHRRRQPLGRKEHGNVTGY